MNDTMHGLRVPSAPVAAAGAIPRRPRRVLRVLLPALFCAVLAACQPSGPDSDATQAAQAAPQGTEPDEGFKLIAQFNGVWASADQGRSGSGTVFMLGHSVDHEMEIARNGVGLDLQSDDVDPERGTATYRFRKSRTREPVTFARIPHKVANGEPFVLRVTYADGTHEDLLPLRRFSQKDLEDLDAAVYERPMVQTALRGDAGNGPSLRANCRATDFRSRQVCSNPVLKAQDAGLAQRFEALQRSGKDVEGSRAAAARQLDACNDSACLARVYKEWVGYLDNSFGPASTQD